MFPKQQQVWQKAAGVSTDKVIGDMASNAADFARFSMEGAEGFAKSSR